MRFRTRSSEQGAASIEAAIISSAVLVPLLLGMVVWGNWFWMAQRVDPMASRVPVDGIVGTFTCEELATRVQSTVVDNLADNELGIPVHLADVGVQIVKVLPTVGAVVQVSVTVDGASSLGGLVPLPNGGDLVSSATYRLDNVVVSSESCL